MIVMFLTLYIIYRVPREMFEHYGFTTTLLVSVKHRWSVAQFGQRFVYNDYILGAQWLSDRVLDSRSRGRGFEPRRRHCVVVIEQDTFILA